MKITFWDKQRGETIHVKNVQHIGISRDAKGRSYLCHKDSGYDEYYRCSRFDIESIDGESRDEE